MIRIRTIVADRDFNLSATLVHFGFGQKSRTRVTRYFSIIVSLDLISEIPSIGSRNFPFLILLEVPDALQASIVDRLTKPSTNKIHIYGTYPKVTITPKRAEYIGPCPTPSPTVSHWLTNRSILLNKGHATHLTFFISDPESSDRKMKMTKTVIEAFSMKSSSTSAGFVSSVETQEPNVLKGMRSIK